MQARIKYICIWFFAYDNHCNDEQDTLNVTYDALS